MDKANLEPINKIYSNLTFFDQFGGKFIIFLIICFLLFLILSYIYILINIKPIIDDWSYQRCNPKIIPFAGLINKPEGKTINQFTFENFNYCTQNILSSISGEALKPLAYITNILNNIFIIIQKSIQSIRENTSKVRNNLIEVSKSIMGKIANFIIPLQQIIISFRDLLAKVNGVMTASLYTVFGAYYTLKSLLGAIAELIVKILIGIAISVAAFWAVPFTWPVAVSTSVIFIAIAIPFAIILAFMYKVLKVQNTYKIPKLKCFDKSTQLLMNDGKLKSISLLKPGDKLDGDNEITALFKVETTGSKMYKLNNIIVSNSHKVYYNNNWINVENHPDAIIIENYNEPYLYCLNTNNKLIKINNIIFSDWDEICDNNLQILLYNNKNITELKEIHKYLDYGFGENTKIKLNDNSEIKISKLEPGMLLENGEKIYGIVTINGKTIASQYNYIINNKLVNGFIPYSNNLIIKKIKLITKHNYLYNILTMNNEIKINDIVLPDYNYAIDRFF